MQYFQYNKNMHEVSATSIIKNVGYIPAILLGISTQSYAILGAFMFLDTVLGVTRVYINHGGRHIRSYKMTAGIISKICVLLVPLLVAWAGKGVGINLIAFAQWTVGALILAQFYSIISNIYSIHLRRDVDEFDAVSWVLRRVQIMIERLLKESKPTLVERDTRLKDYDNED